MKWRSESGAIAVFALGVLAMLSLLAGAWLRMVVMQVQDVTQGARESEALMAAETGIARVVTWFAEPDTVPADLAASSTGGCRAPRQRAEVFLKRCIGSDGFAGYREVGGRRQFEGTLESPGFRYRWLETAPRVLEREFEDVDEPVAVAPAEIDVRLFAAQRPDVVATIVSRARVAGSVVAIRADLVDGPWRGMSSAVISMGTEGGEIPTRIHWGSVMVDGGLDVSTWRDRIPRRDDLAPVNEFEYPSEPGYDRWASLSASGPIVGLPRNPDGFLPPFEHVTENVSVPTLGIWSHAALRRFAKRHGRYFETWGTGLLYRDGKPPGITPSTVFSSESGTERLLFIDTIDGNPPSTENLDTLEVTLGGYEGVVYVGSNLYVIPQLGNSVRVDSPPDPDQLDRTPVVAGLTIHGIHLRGVAVIAGELVLQGKVHVVGAIAALGGIRNPRELEVWFDSALQTGYRHEFPPLITRAGSRLRIEMAPDL